MSGTTTLLDDPTELAELRRPRFAVKEDKRDRRAAILLAAEQLFAQHGYHSVGIRDIARHADVPLALVGYYYGQKQDLFKAIFEHWSPTLEERISALGKALARPASRRLRALVEAFVRPVLRLRASEEGEYYALLVARELYYGSPEADQVLRAYFDPLAHAFIDALQTLHPHASRGEVAWCYQFALGALLHHIADSRVTRLSKGQAHLGDPHAADMLVRFILAGVQATLKR
jgi:AcrR family transcriptional regulator